MHHLFYHANCADGFAAACIARHALLARGIPDAQITCTPVNYTDASVIPDDFTCFTDDHIIYLDFTPPQDQLDHLVAHLAGWNGTVKLTIIDHHEKAAPLHGYAKHAEHNIWEHIATPFFESVFRFTQSGAGLTWSHFFPDTPPPLALILIEHRDLGHAFQQPDNPVSADALNLNAYLFRCIPRSFEAWTTLLFSESPLLPVLNAGARLRTADTCIIASAVNACHWLDFSSLDLSALCPPPSALSRIPAVNGLSAGLISDACTALLKAYPAAPFAASWFIHPTTGHAVYSLRSRKEGHPDGHVNVSTIAAACTPGGGGHPCAAGFSTHSLIPFASAS